MILNRPVRFMPTVEPYNWKYSEVQIYARRFGSLKDLNEKCNKFLVVKNKTFFSILLQIAGGSRECYNIPISALTQGNRAPARQPKIN